MDSKKIIARMDKIYWLNSLLPIMLIYIINSIFFTMPEFRVYIQPVSQILMTIYAVIIALYCIVSGKVKEGNKLIIGSMLVFSAINFISYLITDNGNSFYALSIVFMIPVNYLAFGLPRTDIPESQRRREVEIVICVFLILATLWNIVLLIIEGCTNGLADVLKGERRLYGISGQPNRLGFFTSTAMFFSIYCFIKYKRILIRGLSVFCFFYNMLILYMTNSRSSQIFLIVALGILLLCFIYKKFSLKSFIVFFFGCLFIGIFGIVGIVLSRGDISTFSIYDLLNSISTGRMDLFVAGIKAGIDSPIYGNSYSYLCEIYDPVQMAHNLYIDLFARYGIFSLIAFMIFAMAVLVYSLILLLNTSKYKDLDLLFVFCFALFVGYLFQHLFDVFIFLSGYVSGNVFFIICSGYLSYHISKADFKLNYNSKNYEG